MGGQPGKPKPIGNPPIRYEPPRRPPIEEPPRPIPPPPEERPLFEGDVRFDDEPLAGPVNLFDEAQVAEIECRAETPIAVLELSLELGWPRTGSTFFLKPISAQSRSTA